MTCTLAPAIPTESVQQKSRFHVYPLRLERTAPRRKAVNILQAALQEAAAAARSTQQEMHRTDAHRRMQRFLTDACAAHVEADRPPCEGPADVQQADL